MGVSKITKFWQMGVMAVNSGIVLYAIILLFQDQRSKLHTPVPLILLSLAGICLLVNLAYLLFNLAPFYLGFRNRIHFKFKDQKDMTTRGTIPREGLAPGYDEETVGVDSEPVLDKE